VKRRDGEAVERRAGDGEEGKEKGFPAGGARAPTVDVSNENVVEARGGGKRCRGREAAAHQKTEGKRDGVVFPENADKIAGVGKSVCPGPG